MLFTNSSEFQVPAGKEYVRALVVGGGGGGSSFMNGGGGSGFVAADTVKVTPGTIYRVTVGEGGACNMNGSASAFATLKVDGAFRSSNFGGNGGSGGGGCFYQCSGGATANGGSGGSDGKTCSNTSICAAGKGQGLYADLLSIFTKTIVSEGEGGAYGYGLSSGKNTAGGGAGGVLINGNGPNGGDGDRHYRYGSGGKGGIGYGAGGGAGGFDGRAVYNGGNGAPGVVYIEWD